MKRKVIASFSVKKQSRKMTKDELQDHVNITRKSGHVHKSKKIYSRKRRHHDYN